MSAALAKAGGCAPGRALFRAASLALCLGGGALAMHGAWVPVTARVAQAQLDRDFERGLAQNGATKPAAKPGPIRREKAPIPTAKLALPLSEMPASATARAKLRMIAAGKPLARITVERLRVRDIVLAGPPSHDALARGPTVVKQANDESPVTVLAAHRDTHFLFIRDLREGDIMAMEYVTGEVERYRVTYFETVRFDQFAYPLDPPRALLALTTCYPFGGTEYGGPWRRVAWAERIA